MERFSAFCSMLKKLSNTYVAELLWTRHIRRHHNFLHPVELYSFPKQFLRLLHTHHHYHHLYLHPMKESHWVSHDNKAKQSFKKGQFLMKWPYSHYHTVRGTFISVHVMKVYIGVDVTSTLDRGEWSAPTALTPGKYPPVATEQEPGWALEPVWMFWAREKSLSATGIWTLNHPAHSLSLLHTIQATIWVLYWTKLISCNLKFLDEFAKETEHTMQRQDFYDRNCQKEVQK
jgi:hypothetical protein